ncbi:MAG: chromosome segregation protein SMC [Agathobacter sp.]|jgi:chromosome segregation protein|nr:chromosome segregation protein SMC [Agathobacter sp.]
MYLKSIEVHGFKSFANKIVFDFHKGITGIVGPNGSGKSNVADAVRWVLGEQSVKQLRGSSMQDVIFAGTENRKPLSYAYVAITLDNSDHQLAIDYEEVTVARRLYRSGESEYLINGSPCRLKEVSELFYDTGIGKEGYSIIGQGQIDRILSGKPEERRELFDEAAGIVKFKKRKATAQKKLENERDNLVRVNDILAELERQVGPLERQSEKAKTYLKKKSELKEYDVNMFLLESEQIRSQQKDVEDKFQIADAQLKESNADYEKIRTEYEQLGQSMAQMDEKINSIRENISNTSVMKEKLESQIQILTEQIHTAEMTDEHLQSRLDAIDQEKAQRSEQSATYIAEKEKLDEQLLETQNKQNEAQEKLASVQQEIARCNQGIENGQKELYELLNNKAGIQSKQQRFDTMLEQINIRKAELGKRLLDRKTQEADLNTVLSDYQKELEAVSLEIIDLKKKEEELTGKEKEWRDKLRENGRKLEENQTAFHKQQSRLESLKNIAERYDGYGNSIRKVMEQKASNPGLLGVVSDLIQVEKKYETAIETALGGNIQNIVTEDESTAKKMIGFLKQNRLGRATFLPLTSVSAKGNPKNETLLDEEGVLGIANRLVKCDKKYDEVAAYLLGRVLVVDTIDHAITLAKKNHYSLHIVTLEGEYLSPGGSMTGGAFKNSSNLLARKREIEELEQKVDSIRKELSELKNRREDIRTAIELNADELDQVKEELQQKYLVQNTAKMNVDRAKQQRNESEAVFTGLMGEKQQIEQQIEEIDNNKKQILDEIEYSKKREQEINEESNAFQKILEEQAKLENEASQKLSNIQLETANIKQKVEFAQVNIDRINGEVEKFDAERADLLENAAQSKEDAKKKQQDIEEIKKTIAASGESHGKLEEELRESVAKKEQMSADYRGFFQKQEEISKRCNDLDKEIFRLNNQREKLKEAGEYQTNYLWEEYELTPHAALELQNDIYDDLTALKKMVAEVKDEIRKLGDVNVNAIEEYKEVSERYQFLKGQHDDLVEAEQTLVGIIEDLDSGMRKQFSEKFAEIQKEFDASFKHLFGGGHGTLELVEDEDILECGIRIIAQPPGKKLQNMMQLSGGEKALTAIALLFAIQALKPSPFCLLDEIEAALDDSNVTRFASYLNKLTKNTQFIVITHRRGTMAAADRLYGITMQEKGVSTLVSVNLIENDLTE